MLGLGEGEGAGLAARRGLFELGFDSMMSVELARRLARALDRPLAPTLVFDHPTLDALVDHLAAVEVPAVHRVATSEREPIAVIGMACRFPGGANDVAAFWRLLIEGRSGISEVPSDRWDRDRYFDPVPQTPGKMYASASGFLAGVDVRAFDAGFFGISPAEAQSLDPQQRLLLELTWEALDDAGRPADGLAGSRTGVYVGIATSDYGQQLGRRPLAEYDSFFATGSAMNIAAGRIAWHLGTHGPAIALDTACSSSLVAAHLAVAALRRGEIDLAIVAGVNLIFDPAIGVVYSAMGALAPDGRCKAFDAGADGMVRGEGGAVVVLARVGDALRAGDGIRAVIRGSAVNHDGRSSGLTTPSGVAQRLVVRDALADAGVEPGAVEWVETHGTGTSLGDPIEANALVDVLGAGRQGPLVLGAVKANVGHLEAAAGLVGLVKVALAMQHGMIPPQPTFARLNPAIVAGSVELVVPTAPRVWAGRLAGLSGFGVSGTNAHLVIEAPPVALERASMASGMASMAEGGALILPLSAHRADALATLAAEWRARLQETVEPGEVATLCAAAALRRAHLSHRLVVVGADRAGLVRAIDDWRSGVAGDWSAGEAVAGRRVAFVFSGHGGDWPGMARGLVERDDVFAEAFAECDAAFLRVGGGSLRAALADDGLWGAKAVLHPLTLAVQVALAARWRAWGVEPVAIVGHSSGEAAAAVVAGALSLDDALRVSWARGRVIDGITTPGVMAVVGLSPELLAPWLVPGVGVAVHNAPRQTVVSGDPAAVEALGARLAAGNVFFRPVRGADRAGHSFHFDDWLPGLVERLGGIEARVAAVPLYSTVTSARAGVWDAAYWAQNLRQPVRFAETVAKMQADGIDAFVEVGPHPLLLRSIEEIAPGAVGIASLVREEDEALALRRGLGALVAAGGAVDWRRVYPGGAPARVLPRVVWQRTRHWMPAPVAAPVGRHVLVERELRVARSGEHVCEVKLTADRRDVPGPIEVQGERVVAPAMALAFARAAFGEAIGRVVLGPALGFEGRVALQVSRVGERFEWHARVDEGAWQPWGEGVIGEVAVHGIDDWFAIRARCVLLDAGHSERERARGVRVPAALDRIDRVWRGGAGEALARLSAVGGEWGEVAVMSSGLHLLAAMAFAVDAFAVPGEMVWPRAIEAVRGLSGGAAWVHVALRGAAGGMTGAVGDVTVFDESGRVVGGLGGVQFASCDRGLARRAVAARLRRWVYGIEWVPVAEAAGDGIAPGVWVVLGGGMAVGAAVGAELVARGHRVVMGDDLGSAIRAARREGPLRGVVDLRMIAAGPVEASAWAMIETTRALAAEHVERWVIVTRGGQAVRAGEGPDPAGAIPWGLGRGVALEHPDLRVVLVDLDPAGSDLAGLVHEIVRPDAEDQVAWRGERLGARLTPIEVPFPAAPLAFAGDATWLVTGGLGGVGLQLAGWLVDRGARHLVLTGRRGLTEAAREAVAAWEAAGVSVATPAVDVADEAAMRALVEAVPVDRPLRGVFHAAGVTAFGPLVAATGADVQAMLRGKVGGALVLDRVTAGLALEHFVCFSSASATWGAAGLALYGAANHALDLLAHRRRAAGRVALTVDWGGWAGGGMTSGAVAAAAAGMGLGSSAPGELLEALDACMQSGLARVTVAVVDWPMFKALLEARGERPLLRRIEVQAPVAGDGPLARALGERAVGERWGALCDAVAGRVAEALGLSDAGALDRGRGFFQQGMDSMMSVRLRRALEVDVGQGLPATVAIEHPTVEALAGWLGRAVLGIEPDAIVHVMPDAMDAMPDASVDAMSDGIDDLSEADLEALLAAELGDDDDE